MFIVHPLLLINLTSVLSNSEKSPYNRKFWGDCNKIDGSIRIILDPFVELKAKSSKIIFGNIY
jgi:hypothetical protein